MKHPTRRRVLSLLLSLLLALSLAPTAFLAEGGGTGGDDGGNSGDSGTEQETAKLKLSSNNWFETPNNLRLEPSPTGSQGERITAAIEPPDPAYEDIHISWQSSDPDIVAVTESDNGRTGYIYGKAPGTAKVTVKAGDLAAQEITVTVNGIQMITTSMTVISCADRKSVV